MCHKNSVLWNMPDLYCVIEQLVWITWGSAGIWTLRRASPCRRFVWPSWMTWAGPCWRGQRSSNSCYGCPWMGSSGSRAWQPSSSMTLFLTVSENSGCNPNIFKWLRLVIYDVYALFLTLIYGFNYIVLVPKVQFRDAVYVGHENSGHISATVYRSGDISYKSTVRCYSRQGTAQVMMDFNERPNTDASIITFLPGSTCSTFSLAWFLYFESQGQTLTNFFSPFFFRRGWKTLCTNSSWWHGTWRRGRAPSCVGKPQEWISIWSIYWSSKWDSHQDKRWCRQ